MSIVYRHAKRGTDYELIGIGKMQAEAWHHLLPGDGEITMADLPSVDMREVAIYRSVTDPNEIWVRPREEFEDGRFIRIDTTSELKELRAQGGVTNLATAIRAFMPLAQVAFLWTKETPPEAEVSQYRETYNNVLRALSALETEAVAECATEGCERPATNRFEAGGVGSTYCGECFAKVIEIVASLHSSIPTVTGGAEDIDPRLYHLNAEALAEIKAAVDGESDQPVRDIIYGLIEEIAALSEESKP